MASNAVKVPVYSGIDLKNATDDALIAYLTTMPEPHRLRPVNYKSNVHLMLGYTAVGVAGLSFAYDYLMGWGDSKPWVMQAVAAYFVINCALSVWMWTVERNQIFQGVNEKGDLVEVSTSVTKFSPIYYLRFHHTSKSGRPIQQRGMDAPFALWFTADGSLHMESFKGWLLGEGIKALPKEETKKT